MVIILKISGISRLPSLIKIIIEGLIRHKLFEEFDGRVNVKFYVF